MQQISTESLNEAAVLRAAGHAVTVTKKPCSPKCLFYFEDCQATRELLTAYKKCQRLDIPGKDLLNARNVIYAEARAARAGGGVL